MSGYKPLKITGMASGLIQEREEFILPEDAYPTLENAYVWRERIKRKQGYKLLGRLRRVLTTQAIGNISAGSAGTFTFNIFTGMGVLATEPNASIQQGSITPITIAISAPISQTLTDTTGNGNLTIAPAGVITLAKINYETGVLTLTFSGAVAASGATFTGAYFPGLPVMGLRLRELPAVNNEQTVAFDTKYAYVFNAGWQEFITTNPHIWTGNNTNFFWTTNYWVDASNNKLFWVTNFSGFLGDPIRYTDGINWTDFIPQIDFVGVNFLQQCLCILPFRGRLVTFNTIEGPTLAGGTQYFQRIRWAAIGNPIPNGTYQPWVSDKRGLGGFLDIPTSESIVSVGFVRDNLVVYCERSTWQLRYTGRSIAPFQIEKTNSELGSISTFSAIQFDTALVGIGNQGVVSCDSYKCSRIDIKIPDLIYQFNNTDNGNRRVYGIRNFQKRLAYWTYPLNPDASIYPDRRLVYNYENDSWAIFTDSLTCLGTFQKQTNNRWIDFHIPWQDMNFPWTSGGALFPDIVGGNQQGFVEILDELVTNDVSLHIQNITGNTTTPTLITSASHNLENGQIIKISGIPTGTPFATSLNGNIFQVDMVTTDTFELYVYDPATEEFSSPQKDAPAIYVGGGLISIRDNFSIVSKKFNHLDEGQKIQMGYIDLLFSSTEAGSISLNIYKDYNEESPVNTYPQNIIEPIDAPDPFFNTVVSTTQNTQNTLASTKQLYRVYCQARGEFITLEWTLNNAQMVSVAQESEVQIDAMILWERPAGRLV